MTEEYNALLKQSTWFSLLYLVVRVLLVVNGCIVLNVTLMVVLQNTKHVWLPKGIIKRLVLIMKKPLAR